MSKMPVADVRRGENAPFQFRFGLVQFIDELGLLHLRDFRRFKRRRLEGAGGEGITHLFAADYHDGLTERVGNPFLSAPCVLHADVRLYAPEVRAFAARRHGERIRAPKHCVSIFVAVRP